MKKKLFLIDAYALIFRFHYAFITSPMRNGEGRNVSAVFGFVRFLYELIDRELPEYLGVAFDPKGGNFRHKLYDQYKANREATPEDIIYATPIIKDILRAMNIPILEVAGYEADDVIGTLSHKACTTGEFFTYMVTPDKDYGQLVNDCTVMYKPAKGASGIEIWGEKEVCEHFNIARTDQIIDILAIWGDSADNIPGVAGIGEKGAAKLIAEFDSVDGILQNIDKVKGKAKEKIENSMEMLKLSRTLATIRLDVPIDFCAKELKICPADTAALSEIYRRHNFRFFLQRLSSENLHLNLEANNKAAASFKAKSYSEQKVEATQGSLFESAPQGEELVVESTAFHTIASRKHNYISIKNLEELRALCTKLLKCKVVAIDTETTSLSAIEAELVGLSLSAKEGEAYWVATPHESAKDYLEVLKPLLLSKEVRKVGQNIKYDIEVLAKYGAKIEGSIYDTMIMHYLLDPEGRHSMDSLSRNFLGYEPIVIETLIGKGRKQLTMDQVPAQQIADYAAEDADITLSLYNKFLPLLEEKGVVKLYETIEEPLIAVLSDMELSGVFISRETLDAAATSLSEKLKGIEDEIFAVAEGEINLNSARQLGELLFDKLKLSSKAKKTKTGQYKTDEQTLEALKGVHPIVEQILEYRGTKKLLTTYVEALPQLISPTTGRLHSSFNQASTATGRLSSSNPNLQNIPIRNESGREIRRAFVPEKSGSVIIAADYSQIELRVMAHISGDAALREAFWSDEDIHTATASKIFGVAISEVTREQRHKAKTANFGIMYGISVFGLAQRLAISRAEAKDLIDGYYALFSGLKDFMDSSISQAKERGYVETIFGRRRYLNDINSSNSIMRSFAERNAINAPIQGSAADIMKMAMIGVHSEMVSRGLEARIILQVHDEIVIEAPKGEVEIIKAILQDKMAGAVNLTIPLTIDIGVGESWYDAH